MDEYGNNNNNDYSYSNNYYRQVTETPQQPQQSYSAPAPKKKRGFMQKLFAAIALGLTFGVCASLGFYSITEITGKDTIISTPGGDTDELQAQIDVLSKKINSLSTSASVDNSGVVSTTTNNVVNTVTDVSAVVEKVMPSMVSITNTYESVTNYFGRQYVSEEQASGSGIIIGENDDEFIIVTNHHVIADAKELSVQFADEESAVAYVKGYDESMDIAVISVSKDSLKQSTMMAISVAELGDSDSLKIGEPAIAIGNALGYGQSVTTGVISALNRNIELENSYDALIQTSAAINPGNSGGALLNMEGKVVGINSSKIGGSTVEGMGYAIPISAVREIIDDLSKKDVRYKVDEDQRGYLGISGATVDETASATYGFPTGVYVTKVYTGSAAEAAGIQVGDVITNIDGQSVLTLVELQEYLSYCKGGDSMKVTLLRAGSNGYDEIKVDVTLSDKNVFGLD